MINNKRLFLLAYALYVLSKVINRIPASVTSDYLQDSLAFLSLLLLSLNTFVIFKGLKVSKKKIIVVIVIFFVFAISLISRDFFLLSILLLGINATKINDNDTIQLFKLSFYIIAASTISIVVLCSLGLIQNVSTARTWGGQARYAWGFVHSQILPLLFFYLAGDRITYRRKVRLYGLLLIIAIAFFLDSSFDSRNALYSTIILSLLVFSIQLEYLIGRRNSSNSFLPRLYQWISKYLAAIVSVVSLLLLRLYSRGAGIAILIDRVLSSRLRASTMRFSSSPMQLLRVVSYAEYQETSVSVIDNGYLYIIARYGLLYLILFVIVAYYIAHYFQRTKNVQGIVFFISALISCYITNEIVSCNFLPFWVVGIREILIVLDRNKQTVSLKV